MWLSKQLRPRQQASEQIAEATVNAVSEQLGAVSEQQLPQLKPLCPGSFAWRPRVGEQLLVMKDLALGAEPHCPVALQPGECCLYTKNAYLHLTADGQIKLSGEVWVNGKALSLPTE